MSTSPNPIDQFVGARLKQLRLERNQTQKQLGQALDRTFQQVQKYENGSNRISASMLYQIAGIFDVPILYFFQGLSSDAGSISFDDENIKNQNLMATRDSLRLVKAFFKLKDNKIRRIILQLVEEIVESSP